jgi:hypothetical protein
VVPDDPWAEFEPPVNDVYAPITEALEQATDAYVEACNATAVAQNEYLRLFARAYRAHDSVAVTARPKFCDALEDVIEAKCAWNVAEARERACKAKCEELRQRLMAALSWQRLVGGQT